MLHFTRLFSIPVLAGVRGGGWEVWRRWRKVLLSTPVLASHWYHNTRCTCYLITRTDWLVHDRCNGPTCCISSSIARRKTYCCCKDGKLHLSCCMCVCVTGAPDSMHSRGGLHTLFSMVLGGLVAATPHMVAATVMALARLLYEFAGPLEYMVDDLLPAVLALLRTKSREIVKAVLGFVKVRTHSPPLPTCSSVCCSALLL